MSEKEQFALFINSESKQHTVINVYHHEEFTSMSFTQYFYLCVWVSKAPGPEPNSKCLDMCDLEYILTIFPLPHNKYF